MFEQALTLTLLNVKLGKKKKRKKRNLSCGYSNPNLVRRRGSKIYPMQGRLYGREVTFSVVYPSGFKVPCTEAEKCGVDSPLNKA